jgi:hypothetical protein
MVRFALQCTLHLLMAPRSSYSWRRRHQFAQLDGHMKAWRTRQIETFWLQAVLDDRAETALASPHLWRPAPADG